MLADPRRQVARAFHVVQDLRARMAGQHVGGKQHHLAVRVDDLAILGDHAQAVAIAIEGDADLRIRLGQAADQVLQVFRMRRVRMVVREIAIDVAEQFDDLAAHAAEQVAREGAGHAIAAVDGDLDRARQLDVAQDALQVGGADIMGGVASRRGTGAAIVGDDAVVQRLDRFAVDRFAGQHHLEAVVIGWIVAARDHDAGTRVEHIRAEVDHRRGHHAQVDHVDACRLQALRQRRRQFRPRQAAIAADHDPLLTLGQGGLAKCLTDLVGHAGIEGFGDDAANIVGLEDRSGQWKHGVGAVSISKGIDKVPGKVQRVAGSLPLRQVYRIIRAADRWTCPIPPTA